MSTSVSWQDDLTHSRDLSMREIESYGFFVGWFDSWRVQKGLPLERASAVRFWKEVVLSKTREAWQMEAWAEAMRWFLRWAELIKEQGKVYVTLAERLKGAMRGGARVLIVAPC